MRLQREQWENNLYANIQYLNFDINYYLRKVEIYQMITWDYNGNLITKQSTCAISYNLDKPVDIHKLLKRIQKTQIN